MNTSLPQIAIAGRDISKLGIGTWGIGGYSKKSIYSDYINEITQLKYQLSKGLQLIDCWIAQGEGCSVELIRQAIEDFDPSQYMLLCKFDIHKYSSIEELESIFSKYLQQLRVENIDIFQIHSPQRGAIAIDELKQFINQKRDTGLIESVSLANCTIDDVKRMTDGLETNLSCVEILYNLFDHPEKTEATVHYCQENDIPVIAYRPINRGMTNILSQNPLFKELLGKYELTPSQIALQWILQKRGMLALVKSSNRAHINENLDCLRVTIEEKDLKLIDSLYEKPQ